MAAPDFKTYIDEVGNKDARFLETHFDTATLFQKYIDWLVKDNDIKSATVFELLLQIRMINAYVLRTIQAQETQSIQEEQINQAITDYFKKKDTAVYNARAQATKQYMIKYIFKTLMAFLIPAAILIGAAFAPHLTQGASAALQLMGFALIAFGLCISVSTPLPTRSTAFLFNESDYFKLENNAAHQAALSTTDPDFNITKTVEKLAGLLGNNEASQSAIHSVMLHATKCRFDLYTMNDTRRIRTKEPNYVRSEQLVDMEALNKQLVEDRSKLTLK